MKTSLLTVALFLFSLFPAFLKAQTVENFESGNLNGWSLVMGTASVSNSLAFAGNSSLQMGEGNPGAIDPTLLVHQTFQGGYGRYRTQFYCEGTDTEFRFFFQFLSQSDNYQVICKPLGANVPELRLEKTSGDVQETLATAPATFASGEWHKLVVERTCANEILVYIDDVEVISANDGSIQGAGAIALGAGAEYTYADELDFQPFSAQVSIAGDTTFCNDPTVLKASGTFSKYLWSDGSDGSSVEVDQAGKVWLEVTDDNGCKSRDSVLVLTFCPTLFYAANIFSPNFDGINDTFRLFPEKPVSLFHLQIFSRWGEVIFDSEDVEYSWDGTIGGRVAPADMYFWIANLDGFTLTGNLVLLR